MINSYVINDWLTAILFLLFAVLVLLHYLNEERFLKLISLVKINEYFVDYNHRKAPFISVFNLLLFFFQLGVYVLVTLYILDVFKKNKMELLFFFHISALYFSFLLIRYLVGKVVAFIFELDKVHSILSFVKFTYLTKSAIYISPFLLLLLYLPIDNYFLLLILIGVLSLFLISFYVKLLIHNQKLIFSNLFYFILYFCILEIAPLIYLFQWINYID